MNVTETVQANDMYDPDRPWLRDEKDDPSKANWINEFGNPGGTTRAPVFLRGQMMLAIARVIVLAITLGMAGANPWIAALVGFVGLSLLLGGSLVSHVRRLNDAGKPAILALILAAPVLVAAVSGLQTTLSIPEKVEKAELAKLEKSVVDETATVAEEADNADASEVDEKPEPQRRGPPREITQEALLAEAVSGAVMTFLMLSLLTAAFSFFYVARRPGETDRSEKMVI